LTAVQLVPLSAERKTPASEVPAKRFTPMTARDQTVLYVGNPVLAAVQLVPLSLERKAPQLVPAKRFTP